MDGLPYSSAGSKRPVFQFQGPRTLPASAIPTEQLRLSGPSEKLDAPHWPVRGDLAHIRLAGRVFVPHYAVPMPHKVVPAGAKLFVDNRRDSEVREMLGGNSEFNVLDFSGGWAWGQVGEDGCVGYLPVEAIRPA